MWEYVFLFCKSLFSSYTFTELSIGTVVSETCLFYGSDQEVTKRCRRLSWLTNSTLVYTSPNAGGRGGLSGLSQWVYSCAHHGTWSPINFGDLTPYLTYGLAPPVFSPRARSPLCPWFPCWQGGRSRSRTRSSGTPSRAPCGRPSSWQT